MLKWLVTAAEKIVHIPVWPLSEHARVWLLVPVEVYPYETIDKKKYQVVYTWLFVLLPRPTLLFVSRRGKNTEKISY